MTSPSRTAISIVIVSHNTKNEALRCIASLNGSGVDHIILVDSGSNDGTISAVSKRFPEVEIVGLPNVGFGQASNRGVALASTDYVVVANADTLYTPDSIGKLADYLDANPDVGIVGPSVVFPDGRIQYSARSFPDVATAVGHAACSLFYANNPWSTRYKLTDWKRESPRKVDWLSGCCFAVRRTPFLKVGGFDPAYFMFVEDVDLCWRMHEAGWNIVCEPASTVVHNVGSSVSGRKRSMVIEHAKSLDIFVNRHYKPNWVARMGLRAGLAAWVGTVVAWTTINRKPHGQAQG